MNARVFALVSSLQLLAPFSVLEMQAQAGTATCSIGQHFIQTIGAAPDLDALRPGSQVRIGTTVQLTGTSIVVHTAATCGETEALTSLNWSLFFQVPGGTENDVSSSLSTPTAQTTENPSTTSFRADAEGIYRARIRGGNNSVGIKTAEVVIEAVPLPPVLTGLCGSVTFLRVNDVGGGFGPPTDFIDVEVVTKLNSAPPDAMGFQLRSDDNRPARDGMLDLLRDAFTTNGNVCLDYLMTPGKHNGIITRVALTR